VTGHAAPTSAVFKSIGDHRWSGSPERPIIACVGPQSRRHCFS
jgi:hypothetical protein